MNHIRFTELPPDSGIDRLLMNQITTRRECLLVPDNPHASPSLDALVRAMDWLSSGHRVSAYLNCRDRNRIDLTSRFLGASQLGLFALIIESGVHTQMGAMPESKSVYDLDPFQTVQFLKKSVKPTLGTSVESPLLGLRTNAQEQDGFELIRMKRILAADPDFIVIHSNRNLQYLCEWIDHCRSVLDFSKIPVVYEFSSGFWDDRNSLKTPDFASGVLVKY